MEAISPSVSTQPAAWQAVQAEPKATPVIGFWKLVFAVLVANLLTALIVGIIYSGTR